METLPPNALLIGVLASLNGASPVDIVNFNMTIIKKTGKDLECDCFDVYDTESFFLKYGRFYLKKGVDAEKYLEKMYQQISDQNLLMAYKQAIEDFKKQNQ